MNGNGNGKGFDCSESSYRQSVGKIKGVWVHHVCDHRRSRESSTRDERQVLGRMGHLCGSSQRQAPSPSPSPSSIPTHVVYVYFRIWFHIKQDHWMVRLIISHTLFFPFPTQTIPTLLFVFNFIFSYYYWHLRPVF